MVIFKIQMIEEKFLNYSVEEEGADDAVITVIRH